MMVVKMLNKLRRLVRSPHFRMGIWIIISAVLLYLVIQDVDLNETWEILSGAKLEFVALALLTVALNIYFKAIRWQVLMWSSKNRVGIKQITMSLMAGQTLNWFVPGRVGDLSRAYHIGGLGPGRSFVLGTVAVEKVFDLLSYAVLFLCALLLIPLPGWIRDSGYTLTGITALVTIGLIALALYPQWFLHQLERLTRRLPDRIRVLTLPRIQSAIRSLDVLQKRSELFKLAIWSVLVWGTAIWTNHLTALALDIHLPLTAALVVLVALQIGIIAPGVPGRIGVFQYLCILALALFQVDNATGLSYGILLQAIILVPTTLISLLFMGYLGIGPPKKEALADETLKKKPTQVEGINSAEDN
jgi:uncharacterized protein (TIRG00374 family)